MTRDAKRKCINNMKAEWKLYNFIWIMFRGFAHKHTQHTLNAHFSSWPMNGFVSIFRHDIYIRLHFHVEWLNVAATAADAQF